MPHWPAAGRRGASSSQFGSRTSTPEPETPQASFGFPRQARITRGAELQRIVREGKRIRTTHLEVRATASPLAPLLPDSAQTTPFSTGMRVGLIVPKYKQSGVARNRLKRRLRELARLRLLPTRLSADIVIRVRPEAYLATFDDLTNDVTRLVAQLLRWQEASPTEPPTRDMS